jgi:hypothetical protein
LLMSEAIGTCTLSNSMVSKVDPFTIRLKLSCP